MGHLNMSSSLPSRSSWPSWCHLWNILVEKTRGCGFAVWRPRRKKELQLHRTRIDADAHVGWALGPRVYLQCNRRVRGGTQGETADERGWTPIPIRRGGCETRPLPNDGFSRLAQRRKDAEGRAKEGRGRNAERRTAAVFVPSLVLTFMPSLPRVSASLREIESFLFLGSPGLRVEDACRRASSTQPLRNTGDRNICDGRIDFRLLARCRQEQSRRVLTQGRGDAETRRRNARRLFLQD